MKYFKLRNLIQISKPTFSASILGKYSKENFTISENEGTL